LEPVRISRVAPSSTMAIVTVAAGLLAAALWWALTQRCRFVKRLRHREELSRALADLQDRLRAQYQLRVRRLQPGDTYAIEVCPRFTGGFHVVLSRWHLFHFMSVDLVTDVMPPWGAQLVPSNLDRLTRVLLDIPRARDALALDLTLVRAHALPLDVIGVIRGKL
jgi:hypothetical protein